MPNEEDKTVTEPSDNAEASAPESRAKSAWGYKRLLILGGMGTAALVLGVAVVVFVIRPMTSGSSDADSQSAETAQVESSHEKAKAAEFKKEHAKPKKKKKGAHDRASSFIYTIKDIVINPAGTGGTRFLSVSFAFELESAELEAELEAREPVIRDALITILSSKTVAQLTDAKQKEIVRYQIRRRISQLMKTDELAGVYYTDFVLQ